MYLYFNKCRVCGQAHGVGEPHKFGKASEPKRSVGLSAEAIETLASAFDDALLEAELDGRPAYSATPSPKKPMSNAEKQRAYRERQKALASR